MASKNELISKAGNSSIEEDEVIDLLLISDYLDDINDEDIGKDRDYGMHYSYLYIGMSGQKMVDKMNENFQATDAEFLAHNRAINLRIISEDVKYIKEEDGILKYSKDGSTWYSLSSTWGKIDGDITQQSDLQQILINKAQQSDLEDLSGTVSLIGDNMIIMNNNISNLSTQVVNIISSIEGATGILVRLDDIEDTLSNKISSSNVLIIRETNGSLEYTTDGSTWIPVSTAGIVQWGDITGDISNQPDLLNLLNGITDEIDSISDELDAFESGIDNKISEATSPIESTLNNHIGNTNNPHNVTKEQLGVYLVSKSEFDTLSKVNGNIYIVDDTYYNATEFALTFDFNNGEWDSQSTYNYRHGRDTTITISDVITSTPTYTGHTFLGFDTSAIATTASYTLSDSYTIPNNDNTLYAIWS